MKGHIRHQGKIIAKLQVFEKDIPVIILQNQWVRIQSRPI